MKITIAESEYEGHERHGSGFETLTIQDETPEPRDNQEEILVVDGETLEIVNFMASDNGLKGLLETNFSVDPNQEIETRTSNGHPRPNNGITNGQTTNGLSTNGFGDNSVRQLKSFSPGHKRQLSITKE